MASKFGGAERITARLASDTTKWDTLRLKTRVPGLDSLANSSYYVKVGAQGDWDPCHTSTSLHYNNHYGIPSLLHAIDSIARNYFLKHDSVRLRVNDMSLIYGGLLDWQNQWAADHKEHREGKHADLAYIKGLNPQGACADIKKDRLKDLIQQFTTDETYTHTTGNPHFHIRMK